MFIGISTAITAVRSAISSYVKDNLKLFFNFKSTDRSFHLAGNTSFDGSSDYVDCGTAIGNSLGDNYSGSLTLSLWFKADVTDGDDGIFNIGNFSGSEGELVISVGSGNKLRYKLNGGNWKIEKTSFTSKEWNHLAVVYSQGNESNSKMYINGVSEGTASGTFPASADLDFNGLKTIIGGYYSSSYTFDGKMANVGIWSRALSVAEIQGIMWKNYADLSTIDKSSLVSWWALDSTTTGSELLVTTGWTTNDGWSLADGILTFEDTGNGGSILASGNMTNKSGLATGVTYSLAYTVSDLSSGTADIDIKDSNGNTLIASASESNGDYTKTFTATSTNNGLGFRFNALATSGSSFKISNYSLKEVVAEDLKGSNDGTIVGATTNTSAYGGNSPFLPRVVDQADPKDAVQLSTGSTYFDGSGDYIDTGATFQTTLDSAFSFSAWVKPDDGQPSATNAFFGSDSTSDEDRFRLMLLTSGKFNLLYRSNNGTAQEFISSSAVFADGATEWTHIVCTAEQSSSNVAVKMYVNGAEISLASSALSATMSTFETTYNLYLGGANRNTTGLHQPYTGYMANVGIWNKALSLSEVQSVMFAEQYAGLSDTSNLVSWYDLGTQTTGSELITGVVNGTSYPFDSFTDTFSTNRGFTVETDGSGTEGCATNLVIASPNTAVSYQFSYTAVINSGGAGDTPRWYWGSTQSGASAEGGVISTPSAGSNTVTITPANTNSKYLQLYRRNASNITFSNLSLKEVAIVEDSKGSNNGSIVGATTTTSYNASPKGVADPVNYGKVYSGRALDFDGVANRIDIDDSTVANCISGSAGAVSWWAKPDDLTASGEMFSSYNTGSGTQRFRAGMYVVSSVPYIRVAYEGSAGGYTVSEHGSNFGTDVGLTTGWHHFCFVIESNSSRKLYVDGVLKHTETTSYTADTSYTDFAIGCYRESSGTINDFFDGKISNLCTFNTSLTLAQVQELYTNPEMQLPTGVSASNLKGAWMLNEGVGSTVYDGSGEGNNGTITGATFVTGENTIAQTALVRANELAVFDGSDDDVHLTSAINLGTGAESISFWVYTTNITNTPSYIIGRHDSVTAFIALRKTATSYVRLGSGPQLTGNDAGFGDGWNHVLITRTADPLIKFYVNGSERTMSGGADGDGSAQATGGSNQSNRAEGTTTFNSFGSGGSNSNANFGNGIITEIAFFDEDKSSSASTYYNSGTPYDMTNESGLQHYYRNNGSALWQDLKGSNHASAVNGSPSVVLFTEGVTSGKDSAGLAISDETAVANGVRFYGDGYISTPDSPALQVGSADFTIDAWIKPNLSVGDSLKQIVHMRGVSPPHTGVDFHFDDSSNRLRTVFDDNDEAIEFLGTTNAITGVWQHVALVVDRTAGEAKHYINGVQSGSTKDISALESSFTSDPSDDLKIGAKLLSGTLYQKYEGLIDEVRLYNKALSADELLKNYNHGKGKHS